MKNIIIILAALLFAGCCPRITKSHDTRDSVRAEYHDVYKDRLIRDTTYVRDSILIKDRGDTVYIYRDRYQYIDRFVKDTVSIIDTIHQTVYVDKETTVTVKHIPKWCWWALIVCVVSVGLNILLLRR